MAKEFDASAVKARLSDYVRKYDKSGFRNFEKRMGFSDGLISRPGGFSMSSLYSLTVKCPELNLRWLLTGEGNMLLEDKVVNKGSNNGSAGQVAGTIINTGDNFYHVEDVCDEVKALQAVIFEQRKEIQRLHESVKSLLKDASYHSEQVNSFLNIIKQQRR